MLTLGILWSQLGVSIRFLLGLASLACFADLVFHRSFAAFLRWFGRTDEAVRLIETLIVTVSAIGSLVLGLLRAFGVI